VVLLEELDGTDRVGVDQAVGDGHVEQASDEGQLAVDARGRHALPGAPGDVALDVARNDLPERLAPQGVRPVAPIALVVDEAPHAALLALEVVADHVGDEHITAPNALGEVTALGDLRLALAVHLACEALRSDLLAVPAAVLVEVDDPPDARARRALEDAALAA